MNNAKSDKLNILPILVSFIGFIFIFNLYIKENIERSEEIQSIISLMIKESPVGIKQVNTLIIVISSLTAIITIGVYYILNYIFIHKLNCNNIKSSKLLLTVLISSTIGPLISILLIDFINIDGNLSKLITTISLPVCMIFLIKDDLNKKQLYKYSIFVSILCFLNFFVV